MSDKTALRRTLESVELMLVKGSIPLAVFFGCVTGPQLMAQQTTPTGGSYDVTIFELAALQDRATYEHPTESPTGIDWVLVNGVVTIDHGKHTGAKAGQVMYGPGRGVPGQVIPN